MVPPNWLSPVYLICSLGLVVVGLWQRAAGYRRDAIVSFWIAALGLLLALFCLIGSKPDENQNTNG
jgi:hypothetical protein